MWWWLLLVTLATTTATTSKRAPSAQEPVIEEVTAKQLERVLQEKDYVAVFWCKYLPAEMISKCASVVLSVGSVRERMPYPNLARSVCCWTPSATVLLSPWPLFYAEFNAFIQVINRILWQ